MKTALVIGSGGREHALVWKLAESPVVSRVLVAPGNDAFDQIELGAELKRIPYEESLAGYEQLAETAIQEKVDLVVVGPELPLSNGLGDLLREKGLTVFGPSRQAAQIEASKAFAKDVMVSAGVTTAKYQKVTSLEEALSFLKEVEWGSGWVVKADGLAAGKGVRVCESREDALEAARALIGVSGELVIEKKLVGKEISWMAFCDRNTCSLLQPARDYKRLENQQQGPNTGGMGAFSPVREVMYTEFENRVRHQVFEPTLKELSRRGIPFQGVLYAGIMWNQETDEFWVLEFNVRFGDPEAQVLLPRIDGDFYQWCDAVARGELDRLPRSVPFQSEAAVVIVGAAPGYPQKPVKGIPFSTGLPKEGFFYAGVRGKGENWKTSGGRVLGAWARGAVVEEAREKAYEKIKRIHFPGMHFRSDIAKDLNE